LSKKDKLSGQDKKDWKKFLDNPSNVFDKEIKNSSNKKWKKFKFDFHGYTINEANTKVYEIITKCHQEGFSEILFITGKGSHSKSSDNVYLSKGYNKLKNTIPDFINNNTDLTSKIIKIREADRDIGGEGALIIKLKKLQDKF
tara:strand:- start:94 stop:522 length:429 start_codon:yes stop_codon:yes gene_type:complete